MALGHWKNVKVMAFFSAKLNAAQQNYPVHKIEMLAGIEAMLRHCDILQGCPFTWITDHKGLIHLMNQKNLSGLLAGSIKKTSKSSMFLELKMSLPTGCCVFIPMKPLGLYVLGQNIPITTLSTTTY
jgi:hypothetical protein